MIVVWPSAPTFRCQSQAPVFPRQHSLHLPFRSSSGERVFKEIALILRDRKVTGSSHRSLPECVWLSDRTHPQAPRYLPSRLRDILLHRPAHELLRLSVYGTILVKLRRQSLMVAGFASLARIAVSPLFRKESEVSGMRPPRNCRSQISGSFPDLLVSDSIRDRIVAGIGCHPAISCRRNDLLHLFAITILIRFCLCKLRQGSFVTIRSVAAFSSCNRSVPSAPPFSPVWIPASLPFSSSPVSG